MATFSEQLESALGGSDSTMSASAIEDILSGSGTTVQPGTVTPTGGSVNWNQIFENITTKTPLKAGQGLPEVPKGIPASTFYREATKAGKLPSGASQFFVKPLAPETKALNFNTPTTPSTPTITPSTSSSNQNIVRQLRETAELEDMAGSEGNTQISYDDPSQQYSDTYSPTYATKMLADENAFLTSFPDGTTFNNINSIDMKAGKENYYGKNIENLGLTAKNSIRNLPTQAKNYFTGKIEDIKENPFREAAKLAAGYFVPQIFSPFMNPLIDALTSEGMGQIGMPGLNKDDYWSSEGPDGRGVENRSTVVGFAEVDGYAMPVAVDAKGNVLSSPYGPVKGVVMYGRATPAGNEAYKNKGIPSLPIPNFDMTSPNIGDPSDYKDNETEYDSTIDSSASTYDDGGGGADGGGDSGSSGSGADSGDSDGSPSGQDSYD